ncbi:MAG: beta-ribofuranosylaminobenzene 5'-phosphate synthase family protein [Pseudomonadota bacterium]
MSSLASQGTTRTTVSIDAPGRLHLGFLDLDATLGRRYGSIGLAIDHPATRLTLQHVEVAGGTADTVEIQVSGHEPIRADKALRDSIRHHQLSGSFALHINEAIPAHTGLGSGTQLALAVGTAVANIAADASSAPKDVAKALGRGARSAIGIAAFEQGGFLIDGGRGHSKTPAPLVSRLPFPEDWHVLLVMDQNGEGVHGDQELSAFANLPPMPQATAAHLCHLTLMRLLPALIEADIETFGLAISEIQKTVGERFAPHQGGDIWASKRVGTFMAKLEHAGAFGIGQSSWGPTGFAFTPNAAAAHNLSRRFQGAAHQQGLDVAIVRGRNSGALVTKNGPRIGQSTTNKNPMEFRKT